MKILVKNIIVNFFSYIMQKRLVSEYIERQSKSSVRVLLYHDISPNELQSFAEQIDYLRERYNFISPSEFELHITAKKILDGHNLLVTFDDGFLSNREAAKVLDQRNIKAIFFVVSDFVSLTEDSEAKQFISENIFPNKAIDELPEHWSNMNWDDLKALISSGHTIGAHSCSHKKISSLKSESDINRELIECVEVIEKNLDIKVNHFAFPFGSMESMSKKSLNIATTKFNFIHTGLRGYNCPDFDSNIIFRDSLSATLKSNEIDFYLSGCGDFYYRNDVKKLRSW